MTIAHKEQQISCLSLRLPYYFEAIKYKALISETTVMISFHGIVVELAVPVNKKPSSALQKGACWYLYFTLLAGQRCSINFSTFLVFHCARSFTASSKVELVVGLPTCTYLVQRVLR